MGRITKDLTVILSYIPNLNNWRQDSKAGRCYYVPRLLLSPTIPGILRLRPLEFFSSTVFCTLLPPSSGPPPSSFFFFFLFSSFLTLASSILSPALPSSSLLQPFPEHFTRQYFSNAPNPTYYQFLLSPSVISHFSYSCFLKNISFLFLYIAHVSGPDSNNGLVTVLQIFTFAFIANSSSQKI